MIQKTIELNFPCAREKTGMYCIIFECEYLEIKPIRKIDTALKKYVKDVIKPLNHQIRMVRRDILEEKYPTVEDAPEVILVRTYFNVLYNQMLQKGLNVL
jgi:hypothetical protein